ncbi:hypothetical protein [Mycobacterium shigaense]|uniref:hypothetical protein n=1 Tax=Mycobacterium shigaense TaxID=722731 RepID=UPI000E569436|nr:hypothetical protein [Mycobacterium shigaense]MEA1122850.1 hypothetical protein [Mycobacterium shigaense]
MSQPPEHPGNPADPQGGNQNPPGYPPPPSNEPPPGYEPPPPGYEPPGRHSAPPPGYGPPAGNPPPSYPPPSYPPPSYGAPPPPPGYSPAPPPGGYSQPGYQTQPPGSKFDVGEAARWSWAKFTQNSTALVVPVIGYLVAVGVIVGVIIGLASSLSSTSTTTVVDSYGISSEQTYVSIGAGGVTAIVIGYIVVFAILIYLHAAIVSGTLDIADGKPVTIATFFRPRNLVGVILTALLIAVATALLSVICIIPGIIFGFLAQFAIHFVVDRSQSPFDALKSSIATTRSDVGGSLLSWLVQYAAILVGELVCLVGLFVGFPVAILLQTYTYRKLSGGEVVPIEQPGTPAGPPPGPQFA